jgi:hypothetical protein
MNNPFAIWRFRSLLTGVLIVLCLTSILSAQTLSVRNDPNFADINRALKELVREKASRSVNNFYVARVRERPTVAWVYWPEGNSLILMEPCAGYDPKFALLWSRRYLDLSRDVVTKTENVKGSTFLLTKAEARSIVSNCKHGDKFTIRWRSAKRK